MAYTFPSRRVFLKALGGAAVAGPALFRAEEAAAALDTSRNALRFTPGDGASVRRLRAEYMLSPDVTYLNHASIGTVPRVVHEAHASYLALCETHPSLYVWGEPWRIVLEEARASAAELLGADADDLAVTHNTTEGFNVLAHGLPITAGDEVLFSSLNHPGASVPWLRLAERRDFTVRSFDVPLVRVPEMTPEEVVDLHVRALSPSTRVLVIPHVDNQVGMKHPVAELARAVRARGVRWVLVDGAQSAGMVPVDLAAMGADAYSMSPHKWLQSPKGLGLFWVAPRLRRTLPPMWHRTGGDGRGPSARMYEDYSTRAWPAVAVLSDALDFQESVGQGAKSERYALLREHVRARVDDDRGLSWRSPRHPVLSSVIQAVGSTRGSAPDIGRRLVRDHQIDVRAFGGDLNALRLSPNAATTVDELDRCLDQIAVG